MLFDYTLSPRLKLSDFHNNVVRGPMTRSTGAHIPNFLDEISKAFQDVLQGVEEDQGGSIHTQLFTKGF